MDTPYKEILIEIKKDPMYEAPKKIFGSSLERTVHKYCAFHDSYGHGKETCVALKSLIEKFIANGKLVRLLDD